MKTKIFSMLVIAAIAVIPFKLNAQTAVGADVTLFTPISLTKDVDMNFGLMAQPSTAQTCVLSTTNTRTASGGLTLIPGSTAKAAQLTASGNASVGYDITLPASITVNDAGNANSMLIDELTVKSGYNSGADQTATYKGVLSGSGSDIFYIGGKLHIGANQVSGNYHASFNVSVAYN